MFYCGTKPVVSQGKKERKTKDNSQKIGACAIMRPKED